MAAQQEGAADEASDGASLLALVSEGTGEASRRNAMRPVAAIIGGPGVGAPRSRAGPGASILSAGAGSSSRVRPR